MSTALLRRQHSPLAKESWRLIDEQAREVLRGNLSARKFVDVSGPHGWAHAAVNVGRLDPGRVDAGGGVFYGIRKVLPLVEVRVPFVLDLWQLDDAVRGALDPDLNPLIEAANKLAAFEERAIYNGFAAAGIVGMAQASTHEPLALGRESGWAEAISRGVVMLKAAGEPPPHVLIAGPQVFAALDRTVGQYPLRKQIEQIIGGEIVLAPYAGGGFLLPAQSEGDFELSLGQDIAVGFDHQETQKIRLFMTESFTFRVIEPQAVVTLRA
jgi:uncharacterized linocin/CFP29 family protein